MNKQPKKIHKYHFLDFSILVPFIILSVIGLIMVYSSTSYGQLLIQKATWIPLAKQAGWWCMGLVVMFFIFNMKTEIFNKKKLLNLFMMIVGFMQLYSLLFEDAINGSKGWIKVPGIGTLQPAEYFKVLFVWFFALWFSQYQGRIVRHQWQIFKQPFVFAGILILLVVAAPDLGNVTIFVLTILAIMLSSGISFRYAYLTMGGLFIGGFATIQLIVATKGKIFPGKLAYVYTRFEAMADTFNKDVVQNGGHQLANSYYAIHNGGWFGLGLGNSIEKKGYLPEAHTDFIFAITVEELGVIAGICILAILFFMILRMYLVGIRAQKPFNSMMAIGFATMFLVQVFINLGGIIGVIPSTGVTFPFLSQGGNSLFVLCVAVAFVLNVSADEAKLRLEQQAERRLQQDIYRNRL